MRDIINYNNKGQHHGYQQGYWIDNKIAHRFNKKNNELIGYAEWHAIKETEYYIK
jgi:hypothetical protein